MKLRGTTPTFFRILRIHLSLYSYYSLKSRLDFFLGMSEKATAVVWPFCTSATGYVTNHGSESAKAITPKVQHRGNQGELHSLEPYFKTPLFSPILSYVLFRNMLNKERIISPACWALSALRQIGQYLVDWAVSLRLSST